MTNIGKLIKREKNKEREEDMKFLSTAKYLQAHLGMIVN